MREKRLVIDKELLEEYRIYYKKYHPTSKNHPLAKPAAKDKTKGYVFVMSTNEFTNISNRVQQNQKKEAWKAFVVWWAKKEKITDWQLEKFRVTLSWYWDNNRRRDPDNYGAFACKFLLDGLTEAGVIKDDKFGMIEIVFDCEFHLDKENPRLEMLIEEI